MSKKTQGIPRWWYPGGVPSDLSYTATVRSPGHADTRVVAWRSVKILFYDILVRVQGIEKTNRIRETSNRQWRLLTIVEGKVTWPTSGFRLDDIACPLHLFIAYRRKRNKIPTREIFKSRIRSCDWRKRSKRISVGNLRCTYTLTRHAVITREMWEIRLWIHL